MRNVLEWLETAAQACPDKLAVADESTRLTFAELEAKARAIGSALSGCVHAGEAVALYAEKSADVLAAMTEFADIAQQGRDALLAGRPEKIPALVDANFNLRDRIFNVAEENRRMVMTARKSGASAKFAGSGGAIVGTYEDEAQYAALERDLAAIGCKTLKPSIATTADEAAPLASLANWRNS